MIADFNLSDNKELQLEMLLRMAMIRAFEERVIELVEQGDIVGAAHSYIGQEAVAVGTCLALRDDDVITGNHRSHGHPIAKGGDVKKAMAELLGKRTGFCKGKGGSMHLADFSIGILGESGITASSMPVATGAALGWKLQQSDRVSVCFFGDGASNGGPFHESLNLAAIWKLPVIFVCENNQYAVTSSFKDMVATENISDRAVAYNMPGVLIDGQDARAMHKAAQDAVQFARSGKGPSLLEARTYRYEEHSVGLGRILKRDYRADEELSKWRMRDPIRIHIDRLLEEDLCTQAEIDQLAHDVEISINDAVTFAKNSPYPDSAELFDDLFSNPIS